MTGIVKKIKELLRNNYYEILSNRFDGLIKYQESDNESVPFSPESLHTMYDFLNGMTAVKHNIAMFYNPEDGILCVGIILPSDHSAVDIELDMEPNHIVSMSSIEPDIDAKMTVNVAKKWCIMQGHFKLI